MSQVHPATTGPSLSPSRACPLPTGTRDHASSSNVPPLRSVPRRRLVPGSVAYRQALAEANLGLVVTIAHLVRYRTSWRLDIEELKAAGALGLVEAAQRFDPSRGIPFGVFARPRIEGAMLDFLRFTDPVTRQHRGAINAGTLPAIVEVAAEDALRDWVADDPSPDDTAARRERQTLVHDVILSLSPVLQRVIVEHHFNSKTYREIAALMTTAWPGRGHRAKSRARTLSVSRVGQLHARALKQLHAAFVARGLSAESFE